MRLEESEVAGESDPAMNALGVSREDMDTIRRVAKRRKVVMSLAGGAAVISGLVAGYVSAHALYYEPPLTDGTYPFVAPLAALGAASHRSRLGIAGVVASVAAAFTLMFVLTAAAYAPHETAIRYGVVTRD